MQPISTVSHPDVTWFSGHWPGCVVTGCKKSFFLFWSKESSWLIQAQSCIFSISKVIIVIYYIQTRWTQMPMSRPPGRLRVDHRSKEVAVDYLLALLYFKHSYYFYLSISNFFIWNFSKLFFLSKTAYLNVNNIIIIFIILKSNLI